MGAIARRAANTFIRAKIGAGQPENTVFVRRRPTGEIYTPELGAQFPGRDWMLTRILWLSGCEVGFNRLGKCDTMRRYIYIHGTPDSVRWAYPIRMAASGCAMPTWSNCLIYIRRKQKSKSSSDLPRGIQA